MRLINAMQRFHPLLASRGKKLPEIILPQGKHFWHGLTRGLE
jgi:hypothetical protein